MGTRTSPLRMLAFVGDGVFAHVLESQVVMPLRQMGGRAPEVQRALLVLTSWRHRRQPERPAREASIRDGLPGARVFFRFRPPLGIPLQHRVWARHLRAALAECAYTGPAPIIVHCRTPEPAAAAAAVKRRDPRLRIFLDMRGDPLDEIRGSGWVSAYRRRFFRDTLRRAFAGADGLNVVSRRMAEYLRSDGLLERALPMSVVGCCVDTERFHFDPEQRASRRQELGLADKFVVCYCGSMAHWQRPDAVAEAFAAIRGAMPDAHLLAVCREEDVLRAHLERQGIRPTDATFRAAAHREVASYLMAGDVGLLLREDVRTNQVASPVKFAEYLRCGVPVILTPYIGDFGAFATRERVGAAVCFPLEAAEVVQAAQAIRTRHAAEGDGFRQHCSRMAAERLSWEGQIGEILRVYVEMASR
ncbi:MAG: glycosyltransferase [Planctomycetota bacterium]